MLRASATHLANAIFYPSGFDSPGGDLFRLHCDTNCGLPAMAQLLTAADKVSWPLQAAVLNLIGIFLPGWLSAMFSSHPFIQRSPTA